MFDTLVRNGTVIDGSGKPGFAADVGFKGDRISLVGRAEGAQAEEIVDASGKVVCPGFVDPHSHADLTVWRDDHADLLEPLVRQGITTFIGGNCGLSLAPFGEGHADAVAQYINIFARIDCERDLPWKTMGQFLDTLADRGVLLNTAVLAPHGLLRLDVMGMATRHASAEEVGAMGRALDQALEEGAVGLSTGLQYAPGLHSSTEELKTLGAVLKKRGGVFASHLRSYSNTLDRAIDEVIDVARVNDVPAQISHIFWVPDYGLFGRPLRFAVRQLVRLTPWWTPPLPLSGPLAKRLDQVAEARRQGVRICVDSMPTTTGFTHMLAFFPPWALAGSREEVLRRFKDPQERARMRRAIERGKMTWPHTGNDAWSLNLFQLMGWECCRIMAVRSEANKHCEGRSLVDIAREHHKHPFDMACDLLLEEHGQVLVFESMAEPEDPLTERSIFAPIRDPDVAVSTDTILMGFGRSSHLFYGCYPKFLGRYVRQMKLLPLETAIRKMTALPAEHFGLEGRGRIQQGAFADAVVFDPDTVASRATFRDPDQYPSGIEHVFINGHHVVDGPRCHSNLRSGTVLRG